MEICKSDQSDEHPSEVVADPEANGCSEEASDDETEDVIAGADEDDEVF